MVSLPAWSDRVEDQIEPATLEASKDAVRLLNRLTSEGGHLCEKQDSSLRYVGRTDILLVSCLMGADISELRSVKVTSTGGPVDYAMWAAQLINQSEIALEVTGYCASSCANYLIPAATSLYIHPHTPIIVHGGPERTSRDELVSSLLEAGFTEDDPEFEATIISNLNDLNGMADLHEAFLEQLDVNDGYYDIMQVYERSPEAAGLDVLLGVEDLRSCLPALNLVSPDSHAKVDIDYARDLLGDKNPYAYAQNILGRPVCKF